MCNNLQASELRNAGNAKMRENPILQTAFRAGGSAGEGDSGVFAGASNQISLMKWDMHSNRSGRKKRTSVSFFPEIAIHGNFTL